MKFLNKFFFKFSPIVKYAVSGDSMLPAYKNGDIVVVLKKWLLQLHKNDTVIAKDPRDKRIILKRIKQVKNNQFFIVGDNEKESTDSRQFGWIKRKQIIGKVTIKLSS